MGLVLATKIIKSQFSILKLPSGNRSDVAEVVVDGDVDAEVVRRPNFHPVPAPASGRKFGDRHRPEVVELCRRKRAVE